MDDSGFTAPPPPPPPPGEDALPQRSLGEILSAAWDVYKRNASDLLLIVAVVVVPLSFVGSFLGGVVFAADERTVTVLGERVDVVGSRGFWITVLVLLVSAAISVIIWAVLQAAIIRAAAQATIGDPVDAGVSYRWGLRQFGGVLLVSVLVGLTVAVGFLLLVIPGVIFLVFFITSVPALVVENRRATEAMRRSWELARGNFWHVLGVIIVAWILTGVVSSIISAIGGDSWGLQWLFGAIAQIIVAPFSALVSVLLYLDLRARSERLTASTLRAELAQRT